MASEWRELIRVAERWRWPFGPHEAPVVVAAASAELREIVGALRDVVATGGTAVIEAGVGLGKTTLIVAVQAHIQAANLQHLLLDARTDWGLLARNPPTDATLLVDEWPRLTPAQRLLVIKLRKRVRGLVITCEDFGPVERAHLDGSDFHRTLRPLSERTNDLLALVTLLWERQYPASMPLATACDDGAVNSLVAGPWARGGWTVERCVNLLGDHLITEGVFDGGELRRMVDSADVDTALIGAIREMRDENPSQRRREVVFYVEGDSDVLYLTAAAQKLRPVLSIDLLDGCRIEAAGIERSGGAQQVVRRLFEARPKREIAVGLLDNDELGREAHKTVTKYGLQAVIIPPEFDPIGAVPVTVEIEDLIPAADLDRFHAESGLEPEMRIEASSRRRVVVKGEHKIAFGTWVPNGVAPDSLLRVGWLISALRQAARMPPLAPEPLDEWLKKLAV